MGVGALAGMRLGESCERELAEALELLRSDPRTYTVPQLLSEAARYWLDEGDLDAAAAALDEITELAGGGVDRHSAGEIDALRGRLALRRGFLKKAREHAEGAAARFASASISEDSPACRDLHELRAELGP